MTIVNPHGESYRVPLERAGAFKVENMGISIGITGAMVDKLGRYEDTGLTPEEIKRIIVENGKLHKKID
ncbi:hypothetical protein CS063_16945 [Sporanaerobium hydrogeniformans]|uniref:Uncharacterized protein n=2 Tax=Sporanaerobium hydrogeniformans TaxID=3072179 RepID=A0AC61D7F1_9FIRM|nr:hypothetical protein CS063_16945 [Sporanaerobium hydrogeniformans]